MSYTFQAAVLRRTRAPFSLETVSTTSIQPREVLIKIAASGICRTDIDIAQDASAGDLPCILGHEGAGIVEQTGAGVTSLRPGDHVVLSYASCGRCAPCRSKRPFDCNQFMELNFGFRRLSGSSAYEKAGVKGHFFAQSSFATHAIATERNCVKVSKSLPLHILAPLGCGIQTGAGTILHSLNVRRNSSVIVFGSGTVGLSAIMAAKLVKAFPVIAVDREAKRLKLARALGAHYAFKSSSSGLLRRLLTLTNGGADYTLDTTSSAKIRELATKALNPAGIMALFSGESVTPGERAISVIQGDAIPQQFIPLLISKYRQGKFPFDRMLKFYDFAKINEAVQDVKKGKAIKAVLRMHGSPHQFRRSVTGRS